MESANDPILIRAIYMRHMPTIPSVMRFILYDLQIPMTSEGFDYVVKLVQLAVSHGCTHIVASELYDEVCSQYDPPLAPKSIEIAIRTAIKVAWKIRKEQKWRYYFPEYILCRPKPPTNLEFLTAIVYFVYLWQDCCGKEAHCHASV